MKANDLRTKSCDELNNVMLTATRDLFDLRLQKSMGGAPVKSHHFERLRRLIARVKTLLKEKAKTA